MWIGISLGDITGIGPEVTLKALTVEDRAGDTRYLLIGDEGHLRALNQRLGLKVPLQPYGGNDWIRPRVRLQPDPRRCRRTWWKVRRPPRARRSPG